MTAGFQERLYVLQRKIEQELIPQLKMRHLSVGEPVDIVTLPEHWHTVGKGNYAVVVAHSEYPDMVVKVYADTNGGCKEEAAVYQALGKHPAFSECYCSGANYLLLKKLQGDTLYDCVIKGKRVEKQVFADVEAALEYARLRGLYPHDVHGKNLMMYEGRGYVVDVSDFYLSEYCSMWSDLKKAYERIYLKTLYKFPLPIPAWVMNLVRKGYRLYRKRLRRQVAS
jgi:hypothetical protein